MPRRVQEQRSKEIAYLEEAHVTAHLQRDAGYIIITVYQLTNRRLDGGKTLTL
jgi:hypothetical protein